jgi:hypothetical protein
MANKKSFIKKIKGAKITSKGFGAKQPHDPTSPHTHRPKNWGGVKVVDFFGPESSSPDKTGMTVKVKKHKKVG